MRVCKECKSHETILYRVKSLIVSGLYCLNCVLKLPITKTNNGGK